jgi:hypothetical protein
MRFRAGLVLFIFAVILGVGCRKPLTPNIDRNRAPETWITAAPQDTLTVIDPDHNLIPAVPGTIPFRYHLYWAGSDDDGAVAGFYFAVVETVGTAGLPMPPLPGPKPRDYHYTTKRDSTFIFNVFEESLTREHAFYIYAVDNQGKPDPTPARMIFNALDRFPPVAVLDLARATGSIFDPNNLNAPAHQDSFFIKDTANFLTQPRDTVPVNSVITFRWHAEQSVADNPAVAYKYKLDDPDYILVSASVHEKFYNTGDSNRVGAGTKIFRLRAVDQAGGARTSPEATRRFIMNLSPDTWFSGPDTVANGAAAFYTKITDGNGHSTRYREIPNWNKTTLAALPFPGSYLHPESVSVMPAKRRPNRTFFELYTEHDFTTGTKRHRIYVRAEGDTIHMNSWILLHSGGFDPDSPYNVRVFGVNNDLPGIGVDPVLTRGAANGSPVGFKFRVPVLLDSSGGRQSTFPQSQTYPLSDPFLVPEPHIGGYQGMQAAGRAYALVRAEDGNGSLDNRIPDPVAFVDSVERGLISPGSPRYPLRSRVLTFYVDRAPYFLTDNSGWHPKVNELFSRTQIPLTFNLVADDDPYTNAQRSVGGPDGAGTIPVPVYRINVTLRGVDIHCNPLAINSDFFKRRVGATFNTTIDVPSTMLADSDHPVTVEIELCDCANCETIPGEGRCRRYSIPVRFSMAPVPCTPLSSSTRPNSEGPGSSEAGSKTP